MESKKSKIVFNPPDKPAAVRAEPVKPVYPKFKCAKCSDVIWSKREGQFVSCSCGAISVDYDRYMGRHIGDQEDFIKVEENQSVEPS